MSDPFVAEMIAVLAEHGFAVVPSRAQDSRADTLLKRQTWNTNRAVVVHYIPTMPDDIRRYLRVLRRQVAFRCGFVPFLWGIGIQVVLVVPESVESDVNPAALVAQIDNQWAIIQSVFIVDPGARTFAEGRTWGQFVTGKFQDAIAAVLSRHFHSPLSHIPA
jgi:hypothetical protein